MAKTQLKTIFLSASIPLKERNAEYYDTADIIAIRDAVIALTSTALPMFRLVWGGHPSITPIIYYVMERLNLNVQDHLILYQSKFFEHLFPEDNNKFENIVFTEKKADLPSSVSLLRTRMFSENDFSAGIFIGGMDGVEVEFQMFTELYPNSIVLPVASTGAASKNIFDNLLKQELKNKRLKNDYGYMSLFQDLLINKL